MDENKLRSQIRYEVVPPGQFTPPKEEAIGNSCYSTEIKKSKFQSQKTCINSDRAYKKNYLVERIFFNGIQGLKELFNAMDFLNRS